MALSGSWCLCRLIKRGKQPLTFAWLGEQVTIVKFTDAVTIEARKQKAKEAARSSYLKHKNRVLERSRNRYLENKQKRIEQGMFWRKSNPEASGEIYKRYRLKHRDEQRERCREWEKKNKDNPYQIERKKKYRQGQWFKKKAARPLKPPVDLVAKLAHNRLINRINASKRRALKRQSAINLRGISKWMRSVKSQKAIVCYYCNQSIQMNSVHFDHIVPLSKGGPHSVENLCVACAQCNLSKHDSFLNEWSKVGQQMLAL